MILGVILEPPCLKSMALNPIYGFEIARIVNGLKGSSYFGPGHISTLPSSVHSSCYCFCSYETSQYVF